MIAAVLLALDLGYWPVVAAAVLFQTLTELTVTRNYGLASVGVTTMALLLTGLGQHASGPRRQPGRRHRHRRGRGRDRRCGDHPTRDRHHLVA